MVITSSSFASKSLFSNAMMGFEGRSMINPVSGYYGGSPSVGIGGGGGGGTNLQLTYPELECLYQIQQEYTAHLADRTYEHIPISYVQYIQLLDIANTALRKYTANPSLAILFQITVDALTGSVNTYGLNTLYVETQVQNIELQNWLHEIISGINVNRAFDENRGTLAMSRAFELAPLFRYYISLYGVPDPGVGFDPAKLALVLSALERSGITP